MRMLEQKVALIVLGVVALTSTGCFVANFVGQAIAGSGVTAKDTRELEPFHSIEYVGSGDVTVTCGGEPGLVLTTDDNLVAYIKTEVNDGVLEIWPEKNLRPTVGPTFAITTDQLKKVEVTGSGKFNVRDLDVPVFEYSVAGSGKLTASGKAQKLDIEIAGSGKFEVEDLVADDVSIEIAGSGRGIVHANDKLNVEIAGSGKVEYVGSPQVKQSIAGSGKVIQRSTGQAEAVPAEASN